MVSSTDVSTSNKKKTEAVHKISEQTLNIHTKNIVELRTSIKNIYFINSPNIQIVDMKSTYGD